VGLITINGPEAKNAMNLEVFQALGEFLDQVANDAEVRAIIITGAGSTFVAGGDIKELLDFNTTQGWSNSRERQSVFTKLERLGKPSIAAINGSFLGGSGAGTLMHLQDGLSVNLYLRTRENSAER
jgi:enoyl-CoA hydratase